MSWHSFPHMPEEGAHILVRYKGCEVGNHFEMWVRDGEGLGHIEKWCYYQDYQEAKERNIRMLPHMSKPV